MAEHGGEPIRALYISHDGLSEASERALEQGGLLVEHCPDSADWLDHIGNEHDCVIISVHLEEHTGLELLRRIRESHPGQPVVLVARDSDPEGMREAFQAGATDYIPLEDGFSTDVGLRIVSAVKRAAGREGDVREAYDRFSDPFFAVDTELCFTHLNDAAAALLRTDRDELLGEHIWDAFPAARETELSAAFQEARETQQPATCTFQFGSVDAPIDARVYPSGTGLSVYARDVSERKEREKTLARRNRQQAAISTLGKQALERSSLDALFASVAETVADVLDSDYCGIFTLDESSDELRLRAGVGWDAGHVGDTDVGLARDSQAGYTLMTNEPVLVEDIDADTRFENPDLLAEHGVTSGVSVVIGSSEDPWGILSTYDTAQRNYTSDDANFVQSVANILAASIENHTYTRELERTRRQFEATFNNPVSFIGLFDTDGTVKRINETALELVDATESDVRGDPFWETPWVPDADDVVARLQEGIDRAADGEYVRSELSLQTASDDPITVDVMVEPVRDESDTVVSLLASGRDITERKQRERELREQRERLAALNNLNKVIRDINRALAQQTTREEIETVVCERLAESESYTFAWVGRVNEETQTVSPSTTAETPAGFSDHRTAHIEDATGRILQAVRTDDPQVDQHVEAPSETGGDSEPLHEGEAAAAIPVAYEDQAYGVLNVYTTRENAFDAQEQEVIGQLGEIMGLAIAVNEHKENLKHERERLEFVNRLIRHNLLNSLNVVQARAEILDGHVDSDVETHLTTVQDRTDEMIDLIETLRSVMRAIVSKDELQLEPVDLGATLEDELRQARRTYDDAEFEVQDDLQAVGMVMADSLLEEVFENVLTNAVQHNDKDSPRVTVAVEQDADTVSVRVADNGPGVPSDIKDRIFQKGEKGFESPGSGFGLHLVREIVDTYGGTITVTDNEPTGAVFTITLPRATG